MMGNSTQFDYIILGAYFNTGHLKYLLFVLTLCLYVMIVFSNLLLIVVICGNRTLHEPMYIFLCSLFVNELYGSAGLFPFLLGQIISDTHTISTSLCFLQIYCIHTYLRTEFLNLALMSYDRYLAICYPLQYNTHMTSKKVAWLIILLWLYSLLFFVTTLSLNLRLTRCGNLIDSVYCTNYHIVKLACSDTTANNIYGLFSAVSSVFVTLTPILFSYIKILHICLVGSKETRQKAVTTCTPHLASLINFSFSFLFDLIQSRFNMTNVPSWLRILLSLYFLICQPLFNPVMYGLRMSKIRQISINLLVAKIKTVLPILLADSSIFGKDKVTNQNKNKNPSKLVFSKTKW